MYMPPQRIETHYRTMRNPNLLGRPVSMTSGMPMGNFTGSGHRRSRSLASQFNRLQKGSGSRHRSHRRSRRGSGLFDDIWGGIKSVGKIAGPLLSLVPHPYGKAAGAALSALSGTGRRSRKTMSACGSRRRSRRGHGLYLPSHGHGMKSRKSHRRHRSRRAHSMPSMGRGRRRGRGAAWDWIKNAAGTVGSALPEVAKKVLPMLAEAGVKRLLGKGRRRTHRTHRKTHHRRRTVGGRTHRKRRTHKKRTHKKRTHRKRGGSIMGMGRHRSHRRHRRRGSGLYLP